MKTCKHRSTVYAGLYPYDAYAFENKKIKETFQMISWCERADGPSVHLWSMGQIPPDHLLLDGAPNLGPLIPRGEINKFENADTKVSGF
jgi:hypothetical protein